MGILSKIFGRRKKERKKELHKFKISTDPKAKYCTRCEGRISNRTKTGICRSCAMAANKAVYHARRLLWKRHGIVTACVECNKSIQARNVSGRCKACYAKLVKRAKCVDCGKHIRARNVTGRCKACYTKLVRKPREK